MCSTKIYKVPMTWQVLGCVAQRCEPGEVEAELAEVPLRAGKMYTEKLAQPLDTVPVRATFL